MRNRISRISAMSALFVASLLASQIARAQNAPSLDEQLKQQYKPSRVSFIQGKQIVPDPGTVLVIQKQGLIGFPPNTILVSHCVASKYQDGKLSLPSRWCIGKTTRNLDVGGKMYVQKLELNPKKDTLELELVECDSCNNVSAPSGYKAVVMFQFPSGYLAGADAGQISDVISQVLASDTGTSDQQAAQNGQAQQAQGATSQPATQQQPATIQIGQTTDEVVGALGQPEKIVDLGSKKLYVYKDLKITFVNGKVTDVQ